MATAALRGNRRSTVEPDRVAAAGDRVGRRDAGPAPHSEESPAERFFEKPGLQSASNAAAPRDDSGFVTFDFGPGRSQWQADWEETYSIIADWCRQFPPNGRRLAQERAYLCAIERLSPGPARQDVLNLLAQLKEDWA